MAYIPAITDRVLSDVTPPITSKGYFNVSDWERINGNTRYARNLAEVMLDITILLSNLTTPTITVFPSFTSFNALLGNIESLRLMVIGESIAGAETEIKDDYTGGAGSDAPDYQDVNLWESTIDAIWNYYGGPALDVCPTLTANLTIPTATIHTVVDCIDPGAYEIIIQGTGELHVI